MEERREPKLAHRLIPCPQYDVSGMECWLSDMASQGLLLQQDGFFAGVATFEKTTPQKVKYRLQPAEKSTGMWADYNDGPDEEAVELSKAYGWEYIAKRGEFHIYRTFDPEAIELHTDPQVQALAMNAMRKRQRDNLLSGIFWGLFYPWLLFKGKIMLAVIHAGTFPMLPVMIACVWMSIHSVIQAVRLIQLRKKVLQGEETGSGHNWKKKAKGYHANNILRRLIYLVAILLFLKMMGEQMIYEDYIPLTDYTGEMPFATMEDFLPGGEMKLVNMKVGNMNTVREWTDILSPVNYEWDEVGEVTHPDGRVLSGGLEVIYHETKADWIAKRLAREYLLKGKSERDFSELELSLEEVDQVTAYTGSLHFPCIILREGNRILYARFYTNGSDTVKMSLEEWAGLLAQCLLEE
ncbi:MAG: DUF2812 domain-containing protein [Lachnospiraceae bacterium]|nr:DUF2812 domain-containing protein [Lachnospiraceae bacterium]